MKISGLSEKDIPSKAVENPLSDSAGGLLALSPVQIDLARRVRESILTAHAESQSRANAEVALVAADNILCAGPAASFGQSQRSFRLTEFPRQKSCLTEACRDHAPQGRIVADEGEHRVYWDGETSLACKHTNNGRYGFVLDQSAFGTTRKLELRDALPSEYLWRIGLQNIVFGDFIRIEAIVANPYGSPMIQTSQPWLIGPAPEMNEIREFMEDQGFIRLPKQMLELGVLPLLSWYRPGDGVLVFDTKTSNFVRLGDIVSPIDLCMAIYPTGLLEETARLNGVDWQEFTRLPQTP